MKRALFLMAAGTMAAALTAGSAFAASDEMKFGTMEIPYAAFYAGEGISYEVDAVSSATDSKWKNPDLVAGTFNEAHEGDEGGNILGVTYPVAISEADLEALGENNYAFAEVEEEPAAYKIVTAENGTAAFSEVQGETADLEASVDFTTESKYGDYQITVDAIHNEGGTSDIGTLAGVILTTSDGSAYGLRHLENIWRDNLAWSSGVKTVESHGNELNSAQYEDLMGKTITGITYITETGYHQLAAEIYVPVKFAGSVEVESVAAADGSAAVTLNGFPEDYEAEYSVEGLESEVADGTLAWTEALAGAYTMQVSDASGVYADLFADFVLTTDDLPVVYDEAAGSLAPAEGFDEAAAQAFIKNIQTVQVDDAEYAATGKGAAVIIDSEGFVDPEAVLVKGKGADAVSEPIFPESGIYELAVTAAGYNVPLTFVFSVE